jgi:hypothetical protein
MSITHLTRSAYAAFVGAVLITAMALFGFFVLEPQVSRAVDSNPFTITQTIDGAISFKLQPNDVTMNGGSGINGLTGGNATGTSVAVVQTNSATGYVMQISFDNEQSSMIGNVTGSQAIRDYASSTYRMIEPAYGFLASSSAMMGYTVLASTSADVDDSFKTMVLTVTRVLAAPMVAAT